MSALWIMCSSLEWKLRLRLLWPMLGKDGRERTPCWERECDNREGAAGGGWVGSVWAL